MKFGQTSAAVLLLMQLVVFAGCKRSATPPKGRILSAEQQRRAHRLQMLIPPESLVRESDRALIAKGEYNGLCSQSGRADDLRLLPTDQCFKMLPPQRMRGFWIIGFELSLFLPGLNSYPRRNEELRPGIWLDGDGLHEPPGGVYQIGKTKTYLIDFIGRRTRYRGTFGHLGEYPWEIVVDRVISIKLLEPR